MIAALKTLPPWAWLVLALVVGLGVQQYCLHELRSELADEKLAHSQYRESVADRDREAAVKALIETRRRIEAQETIDRETEQKLADARTDADSAGDALQRLQKQFELVTARSRACGNTITAQLSEAADSAARMQADMFGRVGALAKLYAGVADERGIAGSACEAHYDSLVNGAQQ